MAGPRCGGLALLLAAGLLGGCLGTPMRPGAIAMRCINAVLEADLPPPQVVVLSEREFARRFGAGYDGYYRGGERTVYLSSGRDGTILAHELAHHVQVASGGRIHEGHAESVARQCDHDRSLRYALRPR